MIAALESHLRESWSQLQSAGAPRHLAFMKLGAEEYPDPEIPLLLLAFADAQPSPCAVAKVARDPAGDAVIEAEARALSMVQHKLPEPMRPIVPRLLVAGRLNQRPFVLMSALAGNVELHNTWSPERARACDECILSALAWAWKLAQAAPAQPLRLGEWLDAARMAPARDAALASGWKPEGWKALEERLHELENAEWPAGLAHGDYFPGNLLFQRRTLAGVVDWAMASERQPLFFDILTYEFSFCVQLARRGQALHRAHLEQVHALPAFTALRQRLQTLGIGMELGSAPRLGTLLELTVRALQWHRPVMARAFLRILSAEIETFSAATAR